MQPLFNVLIRGEVAKELLSFVFGLISTAIGFFSALYFNRKVETSKELTTFYNIKISIIAEIEQNKQTLDTSYREYIDGVIFNELSTTSSDQQLTNNTFLKFANSQLLVALQNYIRKCDLCNRQKNQLKDFRIFGDKEKWEDTLQNSLEKTIIEVEDSMVFLKSNLTATNVGLAKI